MSSASNNNGRAFEYACIQALYEELVKYRKVGIIENKSFKTNEKAWNSIDLSMQKTLKKAARATLSKMIELEPNLVEKDNYEMTLEFQKDNQGIEGDVRDIIIKRDNIKWEIGISVKHEHEALKHSRIAKSLDFGKEWYGIPCSNNYWDAISPIFYWLCEEKEKNTLWKDIKQKSDKVYIPLLNAFVEEIKAANAVDQNMIKRMMEYLVGKRDYHKYVSQSKKNTTLIRTFNIHGELNKASKTVISSIAVPRVKLPNELVDIRIKPKSKTTVEMFLNEGWQLSFRIHSADKKVQPSLKFDVQYVGLPATVLTFSCTWK